MAPATRGAGDVRLFDRLAPVYGLTMPPVNPGVLEAALDRTDRDVECVIDIGDGSGQATLAPDTLERTVPDRSTGMLCRARGQGFDCVRGDTRKLPSVDSSLDVMTIAGAFYHIPNQRDVVEEVSYMFASGGVFTVNEFGPGTFLGRGLVAVERVVGSGLTLTTPGEPVRFLERVGLEAVMVECGFEHTVVGKKRESH